MCSTNAVIFPRHVEGKKLDHTVWSLSTFHAYVSYHVKVRFLLPKLPEFFVLLSEIFSHAWGNVYYRKIKIKIIHVHMHMLVSTFMTKKAMHLLTHRFHIACQKFTKYHLGKCTHNN